MTVKVEIDDRLATVTIDRPEVRSALSRQVLADQRRRHRDALTVSRRRMLVIRAGRPDGQCWA